MKLSVIVPVYNTEKYLAKCLDSLIDPEVGDYEIIAVDDGSTDSSGEILTRYRNQYPGLVRVMYTPNGGLGHARNVGMSVAGGDYVLFVDSDDWLKPGAIRAMLETLKTPFDIAVFDFVHVDEDGRELAAFSGCGREGVFSLEEYPEYLHCPLNACNKIWRLGLFTENGISFPDRLWYEDVATTPKLTLHAERILYRPIPWYCYLQRRGSITNATSAGRNTEMITAMNSSLDYYVSAGQYERYHDVLEYMAFYHEYLTSVTRVNLLDPASEVQEQLRDDFIRRFPDYRKNPYFRRAPKKYRLLEILIRRRQWRAVHLLMTANNRVNGR